MKKFIYLSLCICLSIYLGACAANNSRQAADLVGKFSPYTRFTMLNGDYRGVEEFSGKTTVIVFWAVWCNKSRRALAKINAFAEKLRSRQDAAFLAVNIDKADKLDKVRERIQFTHLDNFIHAFSGNEVYDEAYIAYCGDSLPHIVVLDKQGKVLSAGNDDSAVYQAFGIDPESVPDAD